MKSIKIKSTYATVIVFTLILLSLVGCVNEKNESKETSSSELSTKVNTDYGYYQFPRAKETTELGLPVPLSGKPITNTPVINKSGIAVVKDYPEYYVPGEETLGEDEMRIIVVGSGGPAPVRRAQGASCYLVQLGTGETFIFDIGGGTTGNLFSLGIHPSELDKLFVTHLHLDHVGGIFPLFDAMGWARNTPLHVWGASGVTQDLGVTAFTENIRKAAEWHVQSKQHVLPTGGTTITPHEIDYGKFSQEYPEQLVYDVNGVKIFAFPVIHTIAGAMGYRLEWKGLSMAYTADSQPSIFEAERAKGVDVFIHEVMPSAEEFSEGSKIPLENAKLVMGEHTTPSELGQIFEIAKPNLGVGMHFTLADDLIDNLFTRLETTSKNPFLLAQDLSTINITSDYIIIRQAKTDLLANPPAPKKQEGVDMSVKKPSTAKRPDWLTDTRLNN